LFLLLSWLYNSGCRTGTKVGPDQLTSLTSDRTKNVFFKPKLFDVCCDFTKVSLEIRARVISRGLKFFFILIQSDFCTCLWLYHAIITVNIFLSLANTVTRKYVECTTNKWHTIKNMYQFITLQLKCVIIPWQIITACKYALLLYASVFYYSTVTLLAILQHISM